MALILTVGLVLGIFPIYGLPTVLCAVASILLGLNFAAVQLVNQLATPLQLAMLVPFVRVGSWIVRFGMKGSAPSAVSLAKAVGASAVQAVAGWLCLCVPLSVLVFFTLTHVLRRLERSRALQTANSAGTGRLARLVARISSSKPGISYTAEF